MYSQFVAAESGGDCALAPEYDNASEHFSLFVRLRSLLNIIIRTWLYSCVYEHDYEMVE